jgi:predicted Fe-S protein YdhL (DUF1289 family)
MVESPCIQVCRMADGICKGCLRTLDEIASWSEMTDEQKKLVLEYISYERSFGPMEEH